MTKNEVRATRNFSSQLNLSSRIALSFQLLDVGQVLQPSRSFLIDY